MSHVSRALPYQLQHSARRAELSIPLTVQTAFEQRTLGQRPGVPSFRMEQSTECHFRHKADMPERAAGWMGQARRVSHCGGTLRPRAEQQTKRRPHDELCANQGASEFPQDYRGKPSPGAYRSIKATLSLRSSKARLFWPRWRHPLLQFGRPRSAEEQRRRFQVSVPPLRPSQRHNPPPT
jgi:hypothetical protein